MSFHLGEGRSSPRHLSIPASYWSHPIRHHDGSQRNLWFTEYDGDQIGRITVGGAVTEFPIPTAFAAPTGIKTGPDGNIWFTEYSTDKIGRITLSGTVSEFPIPAYAAEPYGITAGPDGNLWFTE